MSPVACYTSKWNLSIMLDVSHKCRTYALRMHLVSVGNGFLAHWFLVKLNQFNFAASFYLGGNP